MATRRARRRAGFRGRVARWNRGLGRSSGGRRDVERAEGGLVARRDGAGGLVAALPGMGRGRRRGSHGGSGRDPGAEPGRARARRRAQRAQDACDRARGAPAAPLLAGRDDRVPPSRVGAPRRRDGGVRDHRRGAAGEGPVRAGGCRPDRRCPPPGAGGRARARLRAGARRRDGRVTAVSARAPGKVVLTGEYAVLRGAPAIVAAVDRYAEVRVEIDPDAGPLSIESRIEGRQWTVAAPDAEEPTGGDLGAMLAAARTVAAWVPALAGRGARVVVNARPFLADGRKLGLGRSAASVTAAVAALLAAGGRRDRAGICEAAGAGHAPCQEGERGGAD